MKNCRIKGHIPTQRDEAYTKYHIAAEKHFQTELQIQEDEEAEQKEESEIKLHTVLQRSGLAVQLDFSPFLHLKCVFLLCLYYRKHLWST